MKLTIERADFLKSLNHVRNVVEPRNTIPILSNLLIETVGNGVSIRATDLDIEMIETAPARVHSAGSTTLPAHLAHDIVRRLPDGSEIELTLDPAAGLLRLRCGRSNFSLRVLPPEEFPSLASDDLAHQFDITATDLWQMLRRTRFAISTDETRYYLNGIYLHIVDSGATKMMRSVATDGHRLAQAEIRAPAGAENVPGVIIPRKAIEQLCRLIENSDAEVVVQLSDNKIRFAFSGMVLTSKLIDGSFPDYERVIPRAGNKFLTVDNGHFREAINRVVTVSSDRGRAVKLNIMADKLQLSVNNPDSGSATEELEADFEGDPIEIGFNAKYLTDITDELNAPTARFDMADPTSPMLVRETGDETALYVLMPMRV